MILVMAGTADGREITARLRGAGHPLIACAATDYGAKLLLETGAAEVVPGPLDQDGLAALLRRRKVRVLVDATHPFAEAATANAVQACAATGVKYIRFQRPAAALPSNPLVHPAHDYATAAATAVALSRRVIFLATGTKTLDVFVSAAHGAGKRVVARILPHRQGLERCLQLGIPPADIVAMQGPFSTALNKQLLLHYGADVLVTKESGTTGGVEAKLEAALELSIPVVVVARPPAPPGAVQDIEALLAVIDDYERTENNENRNHHP